MQVVVLHKEVGIGLGFSVAGGVDQNKPVTVSQQPLSCFRVVLLSSSTIICYALFPGSQGFSLWYSSSGRLHSGRGHCPVHQRHLAVRLRPLGGPQGPEESQDSESGGCGPEEGRSQ